MLKSKIYKNSIEDMTRYAEIAVWCNENNAYIEDKGDYYEVIAMPAPTLDDIKESALAQAKTTFAARRDAVRWVDGYGYDCTAEDITNFMAAYTPLLVQGEGTAQYKVHLSETEKGIVTLTLDDMTRVYTAVRTSQLGDYAWYETVRAQISDAQTAEELTAVLTESGITETLP